MFFKRQDKKPAAATVTVVPPERPAAVSLIRNGDFSQWANGERFEAVGPYQDVADGWRLAFDGRATGRVDAFRSAEGMTVEVVEPLTSWLALEQVSELLKSHVGRTVTLRILASASRPVSLTAVFNLVTSAGALRSAPWVVPVGDAPAWSERQIVLPNPAAGASVEGASLLVELPSAFTYVLDVTKVEAFAG